MTRAPAALRAAPAASPLEGRQVWFFSAVPWDFALAGRTRHLAIGLRRLGARVVFVEPPSIKAVLARLRAPVEPPEGLEVLAVPPSIPRLVDRLPVVPGLHDRLVRAWLGRALAGRRPLAIVSNPRWVPILEGLPLGPVFYDCIDDLRVHAEPARLARFARWERSLVERAELCFAVTPTLAEGLRSRGARATLVHGNGVDFELFRERASPPEPRGPRRRIGYVGALYEWVDVALLAAAARALPEHEFRLVGPARRGIDLGALERLPNVTLAGYRPYPEVPRAMASFDVALIPFLEGQVARAADPIKIYEYFCFGTPVVTTPVGEVERLAELLYVASGPEAFVDAIRAALAESDPTLRERRIAFARENDWSERARTMAARLLEAEQAAVG